MQKKTYDEQNIKILNKVRIQPCTCMSLSHSNPDPGSNKTLQKQAIICQFDFFYIILKYYRIFLFPLKFCTPDEYLVCFTLYYLSSFLSFFYNPLKM